MLLNKIYIPHVVQQRKISFTIVNNNEKDVSFETVRYKFGFKWA